MTISTEKAISIVFPIITMVIGLHLKKKSDKKKQREDAARMLLNMVKSDNDYVNEIEYNPTSYTCKGYNPDHLPEVAKRGKITTYNEMPSRLIYNRMNKLKKSAYEKIIQISGKEGEELKSLSSEFQNKATSSANAIYSLLVEDNIALQIGKELHARIERNNKERNEIIKKIENILIPIIEGR